MINIKSLSKSYAGIPILNDINLEIPKGKVISLIGPNGAGKSTLLVLMARLAKADNGSIILDSEELSTYSLDQLSRKISFLRQQNVFDVKITIKELVDFGRFPHSKGQLTIQDNMKIEESINKMNLQDIKHAYIDQVSGGQLQRAFLAMVIAQDTEYILLDEPLNNLDMKHSVEIMNTTRFLADEYGKTVITVVHDINFAANYSDYIIAMKNGRVFFYGSNKSVITEKNLKELFDIEFKIIQDDKVIICNYYK